MKWQERQKEWEIVVSLQKARIVELAEALVSLHSAVDEAMGDSDLIGVEDDTKLFAAMQKASAALADSADAPPEPTEEMVEAGFGTAVRGALWETGTTTEKREAIRDVIRAALAVAQKEES